VAIEPVPVLFAGLLDAHGTKGPAEVPARRTNLIRDVARKAQRLGVPIDVPFAHPFNPLLALRVASLPGIDQKQVIDALYRAAWVERRDITDPAVVSALVGESLVARAAEAKPALRAQTDEAIARGVFGVPTLAIADELFWGTDALPDLVRYLDGSRVPAEWLARWESLPAAAVRPGAK
jgi:2-hydroxychromene-2-carboxylate isomerase